MCPAPDDAAMNQSWRSSATLELMRKRARMLQAIRAFFAARDVLEIETPLLASAAVTDAHLDSISVNAGDQPLYLNTSPEYCMKRFVSEHRCSVYQICKSFRRGEAGPHHNPEFTMLEWYRVGFSLEQLMDEVEALIQHVIASLDGAPVAARRLSYRQLFLQVTGLNPHRCSIAELADFARRHSLDIPEGMQEAPASGLGATPEKDAWLDWLMSAVVTQQLPSDQLTLIVDYPESQCALARLARNEHGEVVARRFEVYLGQLELANAYDELRDAEEQRQRFERDNRKRQLLGKPQAPYDKLILQALAHGLPECAGVAVGLDRLLMAITGEQTLAGVMSYSWRRI